MIRDDLFNSLRRRSEGVVADTAAERQAAQHPSKLKHAGVTRKSKVCSPTFVTETTHAKVSHGKKLRSTQFTECPHRISESAVGVKNLGRRGWKWATRHETRPPTSNADSGRRERRQVDTARSNEQGQLGARTREHRGAAVFPSPGNQYTL